VDPSEGAFDALGRGIAEGKPDPSARYVSRGLTRSRTDKLRVMAGGGGAAAEGNGEPEARAFSGNVTAMSSGASVARAEPETALDRLEWSEPRPETRADPRVQARVNAAEKRAEAKAKGYEGEACGECGNFTLVRNGTCMKCDTCGSTTGCS